MENTVLLQEEYNKFLNLLETEIQKNTFKDLLKKAETVDLNHYTKVVSLEQLKKIISMYKNKNINPNSIKKIQTILPGKPEIVFCLLIEVFRNNIDMLINIEDFCVAQNMVLVETVKDIFSRIRFKRKVELKNQVSFKEIIDVSQNIDKTICIGNSNDYQVLKEKIQNLSLYPYGIYEIFCDSEEMYELKEIICEYAFQNEYEIDIYDDLNIEDAIRLINRDGYKFCSVILSKDKEKINKFKKEILSKNVIANENPFNKIEFELKID